MHEKYSFYWCVHETLCNRLSHRKIPPFSIMCNSCRLWSSQEHLRLSIKVKQIEDREIQTFETTKRQKRKLVVWRAKFFFALRKKEREVFIEYERKLSNTFMFAKAFAIFCHCCVEGWWHCANIDWEVYVRLEMALRIQFLLPSSQFLSLPTASLSSFFLCSIA